MQHRFRLLPPLAVALVMGLAACNTAKPPTTATNLDPEIRKKIEKGIVEPGFTPEMVYLALGKPSVPANGLADATRDGTWEYREFRGNDRDFIRGGFRRRVVFDPSRRSDVVITEPIDPRVMPGLRAHTLIITFRDGRVTEIARVEQI